LILLTILEHDNNRVWFNEDSFTTKLDFVKKFIRDPEMWKEKGGGRKRENVPKELQEVAEMAAKVDLAKLATAMVR
jgi:hypothetical protein